MALQSSDPVASFSTYFKRPQQPDLTRRGQKRTKVIATVGPSCDEEDILRRMYHAGMNVARLNMSHGEHADHQRHLDLIRKLNYDTMRPVAVLVDLQGPKIRLGDLRPEEEHVWTAGQRVVLTIEDIPGGGDAARVSCSYKHLARDVRPGHHILVDDGKMRLEVMAVHGHDVHCLVIIGGPVKSRKGVNLPDTQVSAPSLSRKDLDDLAWAVRADADFIALSFVRNADDVRLLKNHMLTMDREIPVIAKIERPEAVTNIEAILEEADGIMVARGDLGIEISTDRLPVVQKHLITRANVHGKLVITATQMLESMMENAVPTRAESSDVANAIFDGSDAIMLSGETAAGDHPIAAVEEMSKIAVEAENSPYMPDPTVQEPLTDFDHYSFAICGALDQLARSVDARGIALVSESWRKIQLMAKCRNPRPVALCCCDERLWRRASMLWGVIPLLLEEQSDHEALLESALDEATDQGIFNKKDVIVLLQGHGTDNEKILRILNAKR